MNRPIWIKWGREASFHIRTKPAVHGTHSNPHKGKPLHLLFGTERNPFHGHISSIYVGVEGWLPGRGGWYWVKKISLLWRAWPVGHQP